MEVNVAFSIRATDHLAEALPSERSGRGKLFKSEQI
jgi:hypothetical protein